MGCLGPYVGPSPTLWPGMWAECNLGVCVCGLRVCMTGLAPPPTMSPMRAWCPISPHPALHLASVCSGFLRLWLVATCPGGLQKSLPPACLSLAVVVGASALPAPHCHGLSL